MNIYRDSDQITISIKGQTETMHISEWSRLIAKPERTNRFVFERDHFSDDVQVELPSDCG